MSIISHEHWPMDFEMSSEESKRLTDGLDKQKITVTQHVCAHVN